MQDFYEMHVVHIFFFFFIKILHNRFICDNYARLLTLTVDVLFSAQLCVDNTVAYCDTIYKPTVDP